MLINDVAHAAVMFLHDKPWEKLTDGGALVFGVEDDEGLSYAVLTGEENGCSLALCPDAQALAGYAALLNAKKNRADEMELISLQLDQDFIEIRRDQPDEFHLNRWLKVFGVEEEKWPKYLTVMRRHEPGHLPRYISDEEGVKLAHALHAANWLSAGSGAEAMKALSGQNGENGMLCVRVDEDFDFTCRVEAQPGGVTAKYPSLSLQDELAARRLRRLPVSGAEVTCAIRMLPVPMDEEAERVAMVMLLLDDRMGVAAAPVIADYEKQYPELASEYIAYVEECGRPKSITAADPRAYCLLNELAGQMSTPIRRAESSDAINEAMRSMLNFMKGSVQKESKSSGRAAKASGRGICLYCEKEYAASGMTKHIRTCGAEHRQPGDAEYFMIRVTAADDPNFWMYVDVKKDASLRQLDQFLRDTWVECCGHMSAFTIGGEEYLSDSSEGGYGMNAKLMKVLKNGSKFSYEYDFGTPTELKLQVVDEYTAKDRRKKAVPAARNIMPKYQCVKCGKRAELVLRMGMEPIEDSVFCEECAMKEEYAESMLPLLNSPRTGLCGYGGWFGMDDE